MKKIFLCFSIFVIFLFIFTFDVNASKKNCDDGVSEQRAVSNLNPDISKQAVQTWSDKMWDSGDYNAFCVYDFASTNSVTEAGAPFYNACVGGDCHYYYAVGLNKNNNIEYYPISLKGYTANPTCNIGYIKNHFFEFYKDTMASSFLSSNDIATSRRYALIISDGKSDSCFQVSKGDFYNGNKYYCPKIDWGTDYQVDVNNGLTARENSGDGNVVCGRRSKLFAFTSGKTYSASNTRPIKNANISAIYEKIENSTVSEEDVTESKIKECVKNGKLYDEKTKQCIIANCNTSSKLLGQKKCETADNLANGYRWSQEKSCCLVPLTSQENSIECNYKVGSISSKTMSFFFQQSSSGDKVLLNGIDVTNRPNDTMMIVGEYITAGDLSTIEKVIKDPYSYFIFNDKLVCPNISCDIVDFPQCTSSSNDKDTCFGFKLLTTGGTRKKISEGNNCPLVTQTADGNETTVVTTDEELMQLGDSVLGNSGLVYNPLTPDYDFGGSLTCEELAGDSILKLLKVAFQGVRIIGTIIVIINASVKLIPVLISKDASELKKVSGTLITMAVILIALLLLPTIIKLIGNLFEFDMTCINKIF